MDASSRICVTSRRADTAESLEGAVGWKRTSRPSRFLVTTISALMPDVGGSKYLNVFATSRIGRHLCLTKEYGRYCVRMRRAHRSGL